MLSDRVNYVLFHRDIEVSISNLIVRYGPKLKQNYHVSRSLIACAFLWSSLAASAQASPFSFLTQDLNNENSMEHVGESDRKIAQLFYPDASENQNIKVMGIGQASQAADRAMFELLFTLKTEDPTLSPLDLGPLGVEDLGPVVDALAAGGISRSAIETKLAEPARAALPLPFPSKPDPGGVEIIVRLDNPETEDLDAVIEIVRKVESDRLSLSTAKVQFELDDCTALEQDAYQAAVSNAQNRVEAIAGSLNTTLNTPSVAEPFYSPVLPGCTSGNIPFLNQPKAYKPEMSTELTMIRQLFFTYPVSPVSR